jgi:GNAT superfamily N-acetyltransferase
MTSDGTILLERATGAMIRPAVPTDAPHLARMRYDLRTSIAAAIEGEEAFLARCTAWMALRLLPGTGWRCLVAEEGECLLGAVWLEAIEKLPSPGAESERHGYVTGFYVREAARGRGLGSRLLGECVWEAETIGVDKLILWPTPDSRSLYLRHGFAVRDDLLERRRVARWQR